MYAEKINIDLYSFSSIFYIISSFDVVKTDIQIKLDLNISNFNFNLTREDGKDIRFSEGSAGDQALYYWIAEWFFSNRLATIWIRIPKLMPGEIKPIFVFFGNTEDLGNSNAYNLAAPFVYVFNTTPLDINVWEGTTTNTYATAYGYSLYFSNSDLYFVSRTAPFISLLSYEVFVGVYLQSFVGAYTNYALSFVGGENEIEFRFTPTATWANLEYTDTIINYVGLSQQLESYSYNELYFGYKEELDTINWAYSKRNTYEDSYISVERKVEGNTNATQIKFSNGSSAGLYVRWVIIQEYISDKVTLDTSSLYKDDTSITDFVLFSEEGFSQDLTNLDYYHESDCGGEPSRLSNNIYNSVNACWYSDIDTTLGNIIIDFVRKGVNLVIGSYTHYDSGHLVFYNAAKLSNLGIDRFDRNYWAGVAKTGWACIDFASDYCRVACLGLKAVPNRLSGMVKNFIFQGGYTDPRKSSSVWIDLYVGTTQEVPGWQQFYFINENKYKYYKLVVLSTYGGNICLEEWNMYDAYTENIDGYVLNQLRLLPAVFDSNENYFPKNISFSGSNDFINWTTLLDSITTYRPYTSNTLSFWQRYPVSTTAAFRAYKLSMTDTWGGDIDKYVIAEWEMVRSVKEDRTHRVLYGEDNDIKNVWCANETTFDGGWLCASSSGTINKLYDYKVVENSIITMGVVNDIVLIK